jgi:hypothetical protein
MKTSPRERGNKKSRRSGTGGSCLIFGQGSGVTPDSGKAVLRSHLRPKLPATAGQPAVARDAAGCRNHLLTGYSARKLDLAIETHFLSRRLSFRGYFGARKPRSGKEIYWPWRRQKLSYSEHRHAPVLGPVVPSLEFSQENVRRSTFR